MSNQQTSSTMKLVESGILIAMGTVLSLIQPFSLPAGGGITILSMLPIVLIAYRHGTKWGLFSAFSYSVLQMLVGFNTVSAFFMPGENQEVWWRAILICLLDYVIAYTVLGFSGIFKNKGSASVSLCFGSIFAISLRYIIHIVSGAIFFGAWSEWFFTDFMGGEFGQTVLSSYSGAGLALFYSTVYNGLYMIPEIILTAIGAFVIGKIPVIADNTNSRLKTY